MERLSVSLKYTSTKLTPKFLFSVMALLDDLWFYQYHAADYSPEARFFMERVDVMNYIRSLRPPREESSSNRTGEVELLYGILESGTVSAGSMPRINF